MTKHSIFEPLEQRRLLSAALVRDLSPGAGDTDPGELTAVGKTLFFSGEDISGQSASGLYRSDGSSAGTAEVIPLPTDPRSMLAINGKLFFAEQSGPPNDVDQGTDALWVSDGTAKGTAKVFSLSETTTINSMVVAGNEIYFITTSELDQSESGLYKSDGSAKGTVELKSGITPQALVAVGNRIFFSIGTSSDRKADAATTGLWTSDGTAAGTTRLVKNGAVDQLAAVGNELLFSTEGSSDVAGLWKSDGTAAGTMLVKSLDAMDENLINSFQAVGTLAYFTTAFGTYLWRSDGTAAGTIEVKHVSGGMNIDHMFNFNGMLLFSASAGGPGHHELWRSNGKPGNTVQVSDINPTGDAEPQSVTAVGNVAFFSAIGTDGGHDLFATDGSTVVQAAEASIPDMDGFGFFNQPAMAAFDGAIFFNSSSTKHGSELWQASATDLPGNLVGTVFNDANENGVQDTGETGAGGLQVFIDKNDNGVRDPGELRVRATHTGRIQFIGYPPGTYHLMVQPPAGYVATTPAEVAAKLTSLGTVKVHFGIAPAATIHGNVFVDANKNGVRDSSESGFAAERLYIDVNNDHRFEKGEPSVLTDGNGDYALDDLLAGTYHVRTSALTLWTWTTATTWTVTLTAGGSAAKNFGASLDA